MTEQNTHISDINEIYCAYYLNGSSWNGLEKEFQFVQERKKLISRESAQEAQERAQSMAKEFLEYSQKMGYSQEVKYVWWTARDGDLSRATKQNVSSKDNPTDVLIEFQSGPSGGFLGLSAKSTKRNQDIGFKNPGLGTIDKDLGLDLRKKLKERTQECISSLSLPRRTKERKTLIRSTPQIQERTQEIGSQILQNLQDDLCQELQNLNEQHLKDYLISKWMNAKETFPPYLKVTSMKDRTEVHDPLNNDLLNDFIQNPVQVQRIGNESIGIQTQNAKIMKIRFKYESEKLASSMKLSGEPW